MKAFEACHRFVALTWHVSAFLSVRGLEKWKRGPGLLRGSAAEGAFLRDRALHCGTLGLVLACVSPHWFCTALCPGHQACPAERT